MSPRTRDEWKETLARTDRLLFFVSLTSFHQNSRRERIHSDLSVSGRNAMMRALAVFEEVMAMHSSPVVLVFTDAQCLGSNAEITAVLEPHVP